MFNINNYPSQLGKVGIVTGANTGIGYETALGFAKKDMTVILGCRSLDRGNEAKSKIINETGNSNIQVIQLDLGNFASIDEFAANFKKQYNQLDFLINNAGIMIPPYQKTKQGFESQIGINYFGHFYLTHQLLEFIKKTDHSRVVTLSSIAYKNGDIHFEDLNFEKNYNKMEAYGQSKLADLLFAYELDRRFKNEGNNSISIGVHPGVSMTELSRHAPKWMFFLFAPLAPFFTHKPSSAAKPSLMAALDPSMKGGEYLGPTGFREMKGAPGYAEATDKAKDPELATKLWQETERIIAAKVKVAD